MRFVTNFYPELSTGHFSWTRPDPTRRNVDPTRDCRQKVWPDPTRPDPTRPTLIIMYYVSRVQWIQVANREQYTIVAWFRGKQWKIVLFRFCNVSGRWKKDLKWSYFSKTVVSRQQKDCKYQILVKNIRGLIWAGLNSEVWTVFILQGSSRPARLKSPKSSKIVTRSDPIRRDPTRPAGPSDPWKTLFFGSNCALYFQFCSGGVYSEVTNQEQTRMCLLFKLASDQKLNPIMSSLTLEIPRESIRFPRFFSIFSETRWNISKK